MGYKKVQQIRMTLAGAGFNVGAVFTLNRDGEFAIFNDNDGDLRSRKAGFELVETKWQPKVGDRVRYDDHTVEGEGVVVDVGDDYWLLEVEPKDRAFAYYRNNTCREFYSLSDLKPMPVAAQAQPVAFTIEAGKYYRTRDGRKVGPIRIDEHDDQYPLGARCEAEDCTLWYTAGGHYWTTELKSEHDLIAEWVHEPAVAVAASNDNAAPAKFKVGDRVLVTHTDYPQIPVGTITHIVEIDDDGHADLWCKGFDEGLRFFSSEFTVAQPAPTAIVAIIENGQPKPATRPYVHATEAAAGKEAARLAGIHKGQEFGVYVLSGSTKVDKPAYEHEWQRLAMDGRKIDAIRLLRQATGLHLATAKTAVEDWVMRAA
jgi:hypothetical protein